MTTSKMAGLRPRHFLWKAEDRIATIRLDRPERKNPLTFESYRELRDTFRNLAYADDVDAVVFLPNGGNFCSGGDVHDIIGPLVGMSMKDLLAFTRMTGDLVKAMLNCGRPVIAAVDGVAVGAGAIIAMASDIRIATPEAKTAFLFTRVGLAGCDMGACAMLPRIIGHGRAAELLYTGRSMSAEEGERWGFYNRLVGAVALDADAFAMAARIVSGPTLAPWHDQDAAQPGMVDGPRPGDRSRSPGAGDLHADRGFRTRLSRLRRPRQAGLRGKLMSTPLPASAPDRSFLGWPFFEDRHRDLAARLEAWCEANLPVAHGDVDDACRALVGQLGRDGWLQPTAAEDGEPLDVRALCLSREILARHDGLADFAFAMQGLGAGAVSLFGTAEQRTWLARTRAGEAIPAFALSEPRSGSDVASMDMAAVASGEGFVLNGDKTWISNGGIADFYVVFARTGEAPGARGISAFLVSADATGLSIAERLEVIAPHPLARLAFEDVRLPASARIGGPGEGFRIAMSVLDVFRSTVGAAALGFARRALQETVRRVAGRELFGAAMAELQMVQGHLADMALDIDAAALLVYRAAWAKDMGAKRVTREAAMAKLFATDRAQDVIDRAVQLHGGDGVRSGHVVERLYREIRALRIYEGASDVQKVVIARQVLSGG